MDRVAIVDSYSSARRLTSKFQEIGVQCIHVQSTPEVPRIYERSFQEQDYLANVVHSGDIEKTAQTLQEFAPDEIIVGIESGVELADALSEMMHTRTNGTAQSSHRRNKFEMIEAVRAAGLRVARQQEVSRPEDVKKWHESVGGRIVVKPVSSCGSDGLFFCSDSLESESAVRQLLGTESVLLTENHTVLAQEYLHGEEYYVNTVSLDGNHRVCDIWRTIHLSANGRPELLGGSVLMARHGPVQDSLVAYAFQVLDALGIANGPAHMELKYDPAQGPALVEVGARVCGGDLPNLVSSALGEGQLEWTVRAYSQPEEFLANFDKSYEIIEYAACVCMVSPTEGTLKGFRDLNSISELPSVDEIDIQVKEGEKISITRDIMSFPIALYMRHPEEHVLERDICTVRYLDGQGFYIVEDDEH